jgi:hypothetical protein
MCFAVYIGTNELVKTGTWVKHETILYFENLSADEEPVKEKFSKPFIYYVGADTGCSCGFAWNVEDFNNPQEQESKKSPQKLLDFINQQTKKEDVEFYCCWEGDWSDPIDEKIEISIKDVSLDKFYFMEEKRFVVFKQQYIM